MSDIADAAGPSPAKLIAEAVIRARAATLPYEQAAADAHAVTTAVGIAEQMRPLLQALIGPAVAALPDDHPVRLLLDPPAAQTAGSDSHHHPTPTPAPMNPTGTLPHPGAGPGGKGGATDAFVDVLLVLFGTLGAILGIMPALGQVVTRQYVQGLNAVFRSTILTPADVADMVERGIISEADGEAEASQSGMDARRFRLLVEDTGEPPGIVQALELLRRGEVDEAWFRRVVAYSRVRTEYTAALLKLAYAPMSAADAVEAALKQVLPEQDAQRRFVVAGGMAEDFSVLLSAAGNPIGPEAAANLWAHGLIDAARLEQVIAHSRINPQFADLVRLTHHKWLTAFQIETALKAGTIHHDQASEWLLADGYPADQVAAFVGALAGPAVQKAKADTEGQVVALYEAQMIDHAAALADLAALGYPKAAAEVVLAAAEARRVNAQQTAAIGKVRAAYLAGRQDDGKVRAELARLGVAGDAVAGFLTAWSIERASTVRELTAAQIGHLLKVGHWTRQKATARWEAMGYTADDAADLAVIYGGVPATPAPPPPGSARG